MFYILWVERSMYELTSFPVQHISLLHWPWFNLHMTYKKIKAEASVIHKSAEIRNSSVETSHVVMMDQIFLLNPQVKVNKVEWEKNQV